MKRFEPERTRPEEEPDNAVEFAWLRENHLAFLALARDYHLERGRGALVIAAASEPLGEDTPLHYAPQSNIEAQTDEVSQRLASFVADYEPAQQFVAVFIRPGGSKEFEFSMYQIGVREALPLRRHEDQPRLSD